MQGIFQKENTDKALKYGIYRHLPTYEKIIRNLVSFYKEKNLPASHPFQTGKQTDFFSLLRHNILQPDSFLDKDKSNHALDQVNRHNHKVDCVDRKSGKTAQAESHRHTDNPDKDAVEQERDDRFSTGAQGKVACMQECIDRHEHGHFHDEDRRHVAYFVRRVVEAWEDWSHERHQRADHNAE